MTSTEGESTDDRPLRADERKALAMTRAGFICLAGAGAVYWLDRSTPKQGCNWLVFFLIAVATLLIQQIGLDRGFEAIAKPIEAWRSRRNGNGST